MKRTLPPAIALLALAVAAAAQGKLPHFEPDPSWPKPLPNNWMIGQVSGTAVDARDHIWNLHRPRTLDEHDKYGALKKGDADPRAAGD